MSKKHRGGAPGPRGEIIYLETFESLVVNYLRSQKNTVAIESNQKLENLAIYVTNKDGLLVLDSRGLALGIDMRVLNQVDSVLKGEEDIIRVVTELIPGPKKGRGAVTEWFYKSEFLHASNPIYSNTGEVIGALVVVAPMMDLLDINYLFKFIFYIFLISLIFGALGSYRISRNIRRIQKYTTSLFKGEEVSMPDLNIQFDSLAKTIEDARNEVELKDDVEQYISTLAHELRTPIAGIQLTAGVLLEPMSDAKRKGFIENILESNKHMDLLVTRLLDLSRIERLEELTKIEKLNIKKNLPQKFKIIGLIAAGNKPFKKKGSISYSFSHFDLDAEIFFISINKNNISKGKWLKVSNYDKSQLPTVMKKIVKVALVNQ